MHSAVLFLCSNHHSIGLQCFCQEPGHCPGLIETLLKAGLGLIRQIAKIQCAHLVQGSLKSPGLLSKLPRDILLQTDLQFGISRRRCGFRCKRNPVGEVVDQRRIGSDDPQRHQLQDNKRDHPFVHLHRFHNRRGNTAQVEKGKAEWRRQERRLDVKADHYPQPYRSDIRRGIR